MSESIVTRASPPLSHHHHAHPCATTSSRIHVRNSGSHKHQAEIILVYSEDADPVVLKKSQLELSQSPPTEVGFVQRTGASLHRSLKSPLLLVACDLPL